MHKIPTNTAQPEPFYKVVLLLTKKTIAAITSKIIESTVTIQITNLGKNNANNNTIALNPTEINTPHNKNYIAF